MRDLTRGGLSSALNEIAQASGVGIEIDDSLIAIHPSVKGACELLGLDPLYVACEGRFACVVEPRIAEQVIEALKKNELGQNAAIVGTVMGGYEGHRGWLFYLASHPEHQGAGTGRALVAEAERRLEAMGCPKVMLMVRGSNTGVLGFYDKLGYEVEEGLLVLSRRLIED